MIITAVYSVYMQENTIRKKGIPATRSTYRHGNLRQTLLDAGMLLAREGGPGAVVLREATRRAGVAPNAAYRHFRNRQDLVDAVRAAALAALAQAMEAELSRISSRIRPVDHARASVRAIGTGYLTFALAEEGLFRTAFSSPEPVENDTNPAKAGRTGLNPFQLLGQALDELVQAGIMPPERRPGAEYLAWSAVHGLAMLRINGPLRTQSTAQINRMSKRLLEMVERGL